tara:strand:+ start:4014 stop:4220 length:207 start_codon:yes stop_codon:yes gene_type:complete
VQIKPPRATPHAPSAVLCKVASVGEKVCMVMVADAEEYELNRRVAALWAPLRCLPALLKWAHRAQRKL